MAAVSPRDQPPPPVQLPASLPQRERQQGHQQIQTQVQTQTQTRTRTSTASASSASAPADVDAAATPAAAATSASVLPDLPPVSALFLIDFDVKAGYTVAWKRAIPGLELDGQVEYKSLPSGLHDVAEDLVYFVHDGGHAGLSAFVNARTGDDSARNARMIAVGVLVPLSYGRLGRAWRHAEALQDLARILVPDRDRLDVLEKYWETNGANNRSPDPHMAARDTPLGSPAISSRPTQPGMQTQQGAKDHRAGKQSVSDGALMIQPGHRLSPLHPAWSLTALVDAFGPLIFPIHRAALLRKRILICTQAPVREACNFVYDISILSNIPLSVCDVIIPSASAQRLRPLFNVGIHDIPYLHELHQRQRRYEAGADDTDDVTISEDSGVGWVACTTDSILAMKDSLWDVLITMPPAHAAQAKQRVWPKVESSKGNFLKATQRDLRRYRSLRRGLARLSAAVAAKRRPASAGVASGSSAALAPSPPRPDTAIAPDGPSLRLGLPPGDEAVLDAVAEPTTWAALAYSGFMWWASAGEQRRGDEYEEATQDATLLADLVPPRTPSPHPRRASFVAAQPSPQPLHMGVPSSDRVLPVTESVLSVAADDNTASLPTRQQPTSRDAPGENGDDAKARQELAIIAYFHRLTALMLGCLADLVEAADEDMLSEDEEDLAAGHNGRGEESAALLGPRSGRAGAGGGSVDDDDDDDNNKNNSNNEPGRGWVRVESDALAHMGLDVWSEADGAFVRELAGRYFARRAYVEMKGVEVCGLRVC